MTDIKSFKAFDADMKCRGFQYEVGKTYTHEGKVEECESGFHACESPLDVLRYYPLVGSRFAAVTQSGGTSKGESKIASARITVDAELQMPYFIKACVDWIKDRATTGNEANAATTGDRSLAAALGRNSGAKASSGGAIMMVERSQDGSLLAVFASLVGENGIKPDVFYKLIDGKPVEVKK